MVATVSPIRVGTRFYSCGDEFEIAGIDANTVRYVPIAGKRQNHISIADFQRKFDSGEIVVSYLAWSRCKTYCRDHLALTHDDVLNGKRKLAYIKKLVSDHGWKWTKSEICKSLEEIATGRNEAPPSFSTVCYWRAAYRVEGSLRALVDKHWNQGRTSIFSEEAWDVIDDLLERYYMVQGGPNVADAWRTARGEVGLDDPRRELFPNRTFPSVRTAQRRVATYDPFAVTAARQGWKAAVRMFSAAGRSRQIKLPLAEVQADGQLLDVLIVPEDGDGNLLNNSYMRPYVTVLMDVATRATLSVHVTLSPFSSSTILAAFRSAIVMDGDLPRGAMSVLHVDNGSDYISDALKRAVSQVGGDVEYCGPADPDGKAAMERYIGKLSKAIHRLPGTVFCSSVARGDYPSEKLACLTMSQLRRYVNDFNWIYLNRLNHGTGRRPLPLWRELTANDPPYTYANAEADVICRIPWHRVATDGRVRVDGCVWKSSALKSWEVAERAAGRNPDVEVLVDEDNLHKVYVVTCDSKKRTFLADNIRDKYSQGLTLFEHKRVLELCKEKNIKDAEELSDDDLCVLLFQLHKSLEEAALVSRKRMRQMARMRDVKNGTLPKVDKTPSIPPPLSPVCDDDLPVSIAEEQQPKLPTAELSPEEKALDDNFLSLFKPTARIPTNKQGTVWQ